MEWATYKISLAYYGANFQGYAIQKPPIRSVQNEIQKMLSALLKQPIKIVASGRTDAGVHALEQICSFKFKPTFNINAQKIYYFLQKHKPFDLHFYSVELVCNDFHAQFSAQSKTYLYKIRTNFDLMQIYLSYYVEAFIDLDKLKTALNLFVGTHDFWGFSTANKTENCVRKINFVTCEALHSEIHIRLNANGFLRSMVRMIVGAAIAYATGKISLALIQENLVMPQKNRVNKKAPACGLYLEKVFY